jgi:hypothetical protein
VRAQLLGTGNAAQLTSNYKTPGPASENRAVPGVQTNIPEATSTEKGGSRPQGGAMPYPDLGAVKKTGPALESVPTAIAATPMQERFRPHDIPKQEHRRCKSDRERDRGEGAREQACSEPRPGCDRECEERAHALSAGAAARCCVERRTECPCPAPCGADARDGCGGSCAPREACDGDRYEPCRPAKRDYDEEKGAALPPDGRLKISAFALYAERRLSLGECDKVEDGDIGVRSFAEDAQGSQLWIGDNAYVNPRRLVAAPSVRIGECKDQRPSRAPFALGLLAGLQPGIRRWS